MKKTIVLALVLLSNLIFAHSFVVQGTNVIQIQYQDSTLTFEQKEMIGNDILRTVNPGVVFTSLRPYSNNLIRGHLDRFYTPQATKETEVLTSEVSITGTNVTLTVDKKYTDCYRDRAAFFNVHSNAIAQAFELADLLITNPISTMASHSVKDIRLSKAFAPGQLPSDHIEDIRRDLGNGVYFRPSLLGFQMLPYGPMGADQYLWGILPIRGNRDVGSIPIIYYQNRWWISLWHLEECEQQW